MKLLSRTKSFIIKRQKCQRRHRKCAQKDSLLLSKGEFPELTKDEMQEYRKIWPAIDLKPQDTVWARVYKREHGFSPYMVGLYQSCVIREVLNPKIQLHAFDNKAMCDIYFPDMHFAEPYVRRINGVLFNKQMQPISIENAVSILKQHKSYIIKPALDSMQGSGVEKIVLIDSADESESQILDSINRQNSDFIAQEVIEQHPDVAALNPSSVNCCRVTSIYINGKYDYSTILKIGKAGSYKDNWNSSYLVGVSKDGITNDVGFDDSINKVYQTDNGMKIGGFQLPNFVEMICYVEHYHKKYFPNCGMIGWDILVDNKNDIRLIEINVTIPGFVGEQLCCGTFFEPFAKDINDIIMHKR